ncbi:serine/threonine protein kinase [Pseudoalteromonas fuliginea]|uniref:non-specific serine/threonine protein kinase n=1 Tax=Pseudoalteromonas fuliginea TaxID=1872678 RepID=A0AB73BAZ9_9GAMM|nr:RIO1 family regulatory kinase/ATPase [Pseudoalteromonas fuliginea]KAA1156287.1 serine/threonine protein kinase [Pseudoalteromonas fuliginea]
MIENDLLAQLQQQFSEHTFVQHRLSVVHKGRFANAIVYRYKDDGFDLIIKDFSQSPWFIRKSFARISVNQEYKGLSRLSELDAVANRFCSLSPIAVAYNYIEGTSLRSLIHQGKKLPVDFFSELERQVAKMHRKGIVHLDLRNMGNILCGADGKPYFIDFQSTISFARFPRWLQRFMRGSDMSGVYKAWSKLAEHPMPQAKQDYLEHFNHVRKRWIFKGYPIQRTYAWGAALVTQFLDSELVRSITDRL